MKIKYTLKDNTVQPGRWVTWLKDGHLALWGKDVFRVWAIEGDIASITVTGTYAAGAAFYPLKELKVVEHGNPEYNFVTEYYKS